MIRWTKQPDLGEHLPGRAWSRDDGREAEMGASQHDEVGHARWRRAIAAAGVVALAVGASCSSGDDDAGDTSSDDDVEGVPLETGTTQAPASDVEAVTGHVEDLLSSYEDAVNTILADQSVAIDEGSPEVEAYRDLFEPDSQAADEAVQGWRANAQQGISYRPTEESRPAVASWLDGDIEVVSDDEVAFPTCDEHHMESLDADGQSLGLIEVVDRPGRGVAVRVDGRWYLRDLELLVQDEGGCRTEDREDA